MLEPQANSKIEDSFHEDFMNNQRKNKPGAIEETYEPIKSNREDK